MFKTTRTPCCKLYTIAEYVDFSEIAAEDFTSFFEKYPAQKVNI